jgi:glycosyltransferase involved in cell wall biosynthesis
MASELVSVIIPAYNQGQFVRSSVECALAQTYHPAEVIVINDGSTDDTERRLEPFLTRITYISQSNAGLSAARNAGIRQANGEWIALLDADDLWHPQKLEMQLKAVQNRWDVALVGSPSARAMPDVLPTNPNAKYLTVRDFLVSARMGPSSALIRRRCLESVGLFDESLQSVEDRDMWLRIAAQFPCVLVESPCWWYRTHTGQMSRKAQRMFRNYLSVLNKFFAANPEYRNFRGLAMSYLYFDAAMAYFDEGERMAALRCLAQSARYRPLGLGDSKRSRLARLRLARRILLDEIHQLATNG